MHTYIVTKIFKVLPELHIHGTSGAEKGRGQVHQAVHSEG